MVDSIAGKKEADNRLIIGLIILAILIVVAFFLIKNPVTTFIKQMGNYTKKNLSSKNTTSNSINRTKHSTSTIIFNGNTTITSNGTETSTSVNTTTSTIANYTNQTSSNGYLYCVGNGAIYPQTDVYYAPISSSGIGDWTNTTSYPGKFYDAGCSIYNNTIYCVGSGSVITNQTKSYSFYASASGSGIGNWTPTTNYPTIFHDGSCSINNGYIYCVGGGSYSSPYYSYYAPISNSGIGNWIQTSTYPSGLYDAGCSIYDNIIYCVGSAYIPSTNPPTYSNATLSLAYYATASSSGIGPWKNTTSYPVPFFSAGCSTYNNYIYCVGNAADSPDATLAYSAPIGSKGIGQWTQTTSYPVPLSNAGCAAQNSTLYCVGSENYTASQSAYYAPIGNGQIGSWNQTTSYPEPFFGAYCSVSGASGGLYSS
ncbi:MAG: hypothetical protein ABR981_00765 [Candidatus Micrarchaeaceae archaeon]